MPEIDASRYRVDCNWGDVPHLSEQAQAELLASYPPHMRDARSKGIPTLGSGAIYPVPWEEVSVKPFAIPAWWPRGYALDVGWKRTAALWGAHDRDTDTLYLTSEHYAGQMVPALHADAIKARGAWIRGVIDPASRGRSQTDGEVLLQTYKDLGLSLKPADNAVEAGIYEVWSLLISGRLKIFTSLRNLYEEYHEYHRDEDGKIVKEKDHLMDAMRYMVRGYRKYFTIRPIEKSTGSSRVHISDRTAGY